MKKRDEDRLTLLRYVRGAVTSQRKRISAALDTDRGVYESASEEFRKTWEGVLLRDDIDELSWINTYFDFIFQALTDLIKRYEMAKRLEEE